MAEVEDVTQVEETAAAEIRSVIALWAEAFPTRSVDTARGVHASSIVSFYIVPPLRYRGFDDYATAWDGAFEAFAGPIDIALHDQNITVRDDIAFSHSLNRFAATTHDGVKVEYWFRWTACFQKLDGRWRIVHDHSSLPTDFADGHSVLDLRPDGSDPRSTEVGSANKVGGSNPAFGSAAEGNLLAAYLSFLHALLRAVCSG